MEPVIKDYKLSKYYDRDCLKIFYCLCTLQMIIQIFEKSVHLTKKGSPIKEVTKGTVESFSKTNFEKQCLHKVILF